MTATESHLRVIGCGTGHDAPTARVCPDGVCADGCRREAVTDRPRAVRYGYIGAGACCVGLAAVGVVVPGMPTTIFLIVASYLLTRGCPCLERRLVRNRFFGPYLRYLDGSTPMPARARAVAIGLMWTAIATSLTLLAIAGRLPLWLGLLIAASGLAGSVMVLLVRRAPRPVPAG